QVDEVGHHTILPHPHLVPTCLLTFWPQGLHACTGRTQGAPAAKPFGIANKIVLMNEEFDATVTAVRRGAAQLAKRMRRERPDDSVSASKVSALGHLAARGPLAVGELAHHDRLQP